MTRTLSPTAKARDVTAKERLSSAEMGELMRYMHGADYFDNSIEAVAARTARYAELNARYEATRS